MASVVPVVPLVGTLSVGVLEVASSVVTDAVDSELTIDLEGISIGVVID